MYDQTVLSSGPLPASASIARSSRLDSNLAGGAQLARLLGHFAPISLQQMDEVALLNRIDTKYLLDTQLLGEVLAALGEHYDVLEVAGVRLSSYQTLYFDTVDFACYRWHHAGKRNRYKVRSRCYLDSQRCFFEVKLKIKPERTLKRRVETSGLITELAAETSDLLHWQVPAPLPRLEPKLWNSFSRITLVGKQQRERVTIDLGLRFDGARQSLALPSLVVAEVKQDGRNRDSPFMRQMRAANNRPTSFSKYCIGAALLYPALKCNNFKPQLRLVDRLIGGTGYGR